MDDFKIVSKDPSIWIDCIASVFLTKDRGYLNNGYA